MKPQAHSITRPKATCSKPSKLAGRRCSTIVVAHRLSTIRYCDRIYEFGAGRIKASGDCRALQGTSESFRELVALQDG